MYEIARLMITGDWGDGRSQNERLCKEWGLSPISVRDMATEASRLLDFHMNQREELVRLGQVRLRQIGEENGPDRVPAWRTLFENLGELRRKNELTGPGGGPLQVTHRAEPLEHVRALLRDPPPELETLLLEEWGPRTRDA